MTSTEPGVHIGARSRPYPELNLRAAQVAAGLRDLGVETGDRIAIMLRNDFAFLEASGAAAIAEIGRAHV